MALQTFQVPSLRERIVSLLPFKSELKSAVNVSFIAFALVLSWGFIHFDVRDVWFAKLGVPIFEILGVQSSSKLKLFVTEIFTLYCLGLAVLARCKGEKRNLFSNRIAMLSLVFLALAVLRAIPDFSSSPLLAVRNLSFAWYLLLPTCLYLSPVPTKIIEFVAALVALLGGAYFFGHTALSLITFFISPYWIPFLGVYVFFFFALFELNKVWSVAFLLILAFELGFSTHLGFQRTSLVGLLLLFLYWVYQQAVQGRFRAIAKASLVLLIGIVLGHWGLELARQRVPAFRIDPFVQTRFANPLQKSEGNIVAFGENFRRQMWEDAFQLFLRHPFHGIGFKEQVVTRFDLVGHGLIPNDGFSYARYMGFKTPPPPISGPHNSYLNAMARMGIWGLAILILHFWAALLLWQTGYVFSFFLLYAQVLYAFFNVGLEGPSRSVFLLIGLAVAFRAWDERKLSRLKASEAASSCENLQSESPARSKNAAPFPG